MNIIKTILFFILLVFMCIIFFLFTILQKILYFFINKTHGENETHIISQYFCKILFSLVPGWGIKIHDKNNIPKGLQKPFIIVANHESSTDILVTYFLNIQFRWLAKKELFLFPLVGQVMSWSGYIPIKRGDKTRHKAALTQCENTLIKKKTPVLFFPQGTRSTDEFALKFKPGAFKLSQKTQFPILPIVIHGAKEQLAKGSLAPQKSIVNLKILPFVFPQENETIDQYTYRVQNLIEKEYNSFKLEKK